MGGSLARTRTRLEAPRTSAASSCARPESLWIVRADDRQLVGGRLRRGLNPGNRLQVPAGLCLHLVRRRERMIRSQHCLPFLKPKHAERRDKGTRPSTGQSNLRSPAWTVSIAGRGHEIDLLTEPALVVRHDDDKAARERSDIRRPSATGQLHVRPIASTYIRRV